GDEGGGSTSGGQHDGQGDGQADGPPDPMTDTAAGDGATACTDPDCLGASSSSGSAVTESGDPEGDGNEGGGDTGLPPTGREPCQPCETDLHCGGDVDHCVDLGGDSPVCVSRCFEAPPCARGFACQAIVSVEGQRAEQCVPDGACSGSGDTGATGSM